MEANAKEELLALVERKAFDPVLAARQTRRSHTDRRRLEDVQRKTRSEVERYRHYSSARELLTNFKRDLSSEAAKKVHAELRSLGLPTIEDIREEFEERARSLGVHEG